MTAPPVGADRNLDRAAHAIGPVNPAELVSVIVPAYCAGPTIDATLDSVRSQSHGNLEILVIDDGSTDDTALRVARHAAADPRVRLVRQANAGVAAARNRGLREARGHYVAPVDADDLWHPHKVERQLELFARGGESLGLVYTWYAVIDEAGGIVGESRPAPTGRVLEDMMRLGNFVGNGSSALMRRDLARRFGYDPSLRARQAQGCEDFKLYFQMATACEFAVVPALLTGYRVIDGSMSSAVLTMLRSYELVVADLAAQFPGQEPLFRQGRVRILEWAGDRIAQRGQFAAARSLVDSLARLEPARVAPMRRRLLRARLRQWLARWLPGASSLRGDRRPPRPREPFAVGRPG